MLRRLHHEQPSSFAFTPANLDWAKGQISKFPEGRQASAVIPLLWRAQEQEGWLSRPAIEYVADMLDMAHIRALEVATFYFMFQLQPVGSVAHIQVCGTTTCMICGAEDLIDRLKQEFRVVALAGMGREQLRDTLLDARLFVDFGHHPGKDRVPREAALCGAIPVVRRVGAACFPEDVPLPEALLPATPLFLDGDALAGHLRAILHEADHWQAVLEEYRALIRQEKAVFEQEIRALIGG